MTTDTLPPHGPNGAIRRIASALFAILQTRIELIGIELSEEKDRLLIILFLGLAAIMLGAMALIGVTALVAIAFWDSYRWQALAGITAFYSIASIVCALKTRNGLRNAPFVFEATLNEFEKDRELLRKR